MLTPPRISIVTPSLNQAGFIRTTIESVLEQDYPAIDYWIMDGGSTDGTVEILKSYGSRLQWVSEQDSGQSDAINKGWTRSSGEILAWLNSDDYYYPGALSTVAEYFRKHPDVGIVYGGCNYVNSTGDVIQPYPTQPFDYGALVRSTINWIPQPATFIHRRVFTRLGGLDASLAYTMDFDYWLRAGIQFSIADIPNVLAVLRLHQDAKSVAQLGGFADELVAIYLRLFQRPDLPPAVRRFEAEAMGNIYTRAADCAYWADDIQAARAYSRQAKNYGSDGLGRLMLMLALGRPGRKLLEKWAGNPYKGKKS